MALRVTTLIYVCLSVLAPFLRSGKALRATALVVGSVIAGSEVFFEATRTVWRQELVAVPAGLLLGVAAAYAAFALADYSCQRGARRLGRALRLIRPTYSGRTVSILALSAAYEELIWRAAVQREFGSGAVVVVTVAMAFGLAHVSANKKVRLSTQADCVALSLACSTALIATHTVVAPAICHTVRNMLCHALRFVEDEGYRTAARRVLTRLEGRARVTARMAKSSPVYRPVGARRDRASSAVDVVE